MVVKAEKTRTSETKPGNIYDAFAKQMLGQIVVFADFLQNYADPLFVKEIDLDNIQSAPTHYFGKGGTEQIVDLIFQCPLKNKNGGSLMAVVIFEHQSGSLKKIPRKLLRYISAIWDAEKKKKKKVLSAPYFIVLRTGKKPHRGRLPKVSDSLPKGSDGKPLGKTVEIEYDVVDLPAWDFNELVGGTLVRLVLGMLHKMAGGNLDEFTEALKPLLEITDATQRIDLAKDVMPFVAKVFAANDRRLDEAQIDEILKPIFKGKERAMIKTVFEEREEVAEARGQAKGETITWRKAVLAALHGKFGKVPKGIEKMVQSMSDPIALESLVVRVGQCKTLDEFATDL
jgi:hypothetical protein